MVKKYLNLKLLKCGNSKGFIIPYREVEDMVVGERYVVSIESP